MVAWPGPPLVGFSTENWSLEGSVVNLNLHFFDDVDSVKVADFDLFLVGEAVLELVEVHLQLGRRFVVIPY